jgi:hypothetical protein
MGSKNSPLKMRKVAVSVFGLNASGEPDIWQATCETSEPSFRDGDHLETAKLMAKDDDFEPRFACDEEDMLNSILPRLEKLYPEYFTKARGREK